jgi:hypothetical protein
VLFIRVPDPSKPLKLSVVSKNNLGKAIGFRKIPGASTVNMKNTRLFFFLKKDTMYVHKRISKVC